MLRRMHGIDKFRIDGGRFDIEQCVTQSCGCNQTSNKTQVPVSLFVWQIKQDISHTNINNSPQIKITTESKKNEEQQQIINKVYDPNYQEETQVVTKIETQLDPPSNAFRKDVQWQQLFNEEMTTQFYMNDIQIESVITTFLLYAILIFTGYYLLVKYETRQEYLRQQNKSIIPSAFKIMIGKANQGDYLDYDRKIKFLDDQDFSVNVL
ncbi:UNKNOWN [Stylonychia lemnae]|uniref:Transmembrane protein n=1 Tax=Stylonychia lemnae TaxID=5949 RepID=A0A078AR94_STYLE|nr:UNKNOWN [Stylonychia lemnae]|eukprot:CDW83373.1 UNKNOWN [Stylonychia lemnae]